jgi:hypothetical protein
MKYIVTTTIFPPTEALRRFESLPEWKLIVVGDKKTPHHLYESNPNIIYMSPEYQESQYKALSDLIGWNCIQRRSLGYIEAVKRGATIIASVDDDNIPKPEWGNNLLLNQDTECKIYSPTNPEIKAFDPLSATNHSKYWHRGYPLSLISQKNNVTCVSGIIIPNVQADFWDGDPDVDAIQRLIFVPDCKFNPECFPFTSSGISPFNSQNTFFTRDSIKNFFLFPHVGRMDDIWGSFYSQAKSDKVIYNNASVFQVRNHHNYLVDFSKEINGYLHNENIINEIMNDPEIIQKYVPEESYEALKEYQRIMSCL